MGRNRERGGQTAVCHSSLCAVDIMWHSSFLSQLLKLNTQYLLIGHSRDLINHCDGSFHRVHRATSSSHTGCESLSLSRKQNLSRASRADLSLLKTLLTLLCVRSVLPRNACPQLFGTRLPPTVFFIRRKSRFTSHDIYHKLLRSKYSSSSLGGGGVVWQQVKMKGFMIKTKHSSKQLFKKPVIKRQRQRCDCYEMQDLSANNENESSQDSCIWLY